jgi:hypothetical protein
MDPTWRKAGGGHVAGSLFFHAFSHTEIKPPEKRRLHGFTTGNEADTANRIEAEQNMDINPKCSLVQKRIQKGVSFV